MNAIYQTAISNLERPLHSRNQNRQERNSMILPADRTKDKTKPLAVSKTVPAPRTQHGEALLIFRKKVNTAPLPRLIHKPAIPIIRPKRPQIRRLEIALVMLAHDLLHSKRSFSSVVERDARDVMMHDVCLDGAVEDVRADPAEVAVDC